MALSFLILCMLGFISNTLSQGICERRTARWLVARQWSRPFYLPSHAKDSAAIFASVGIVPLPAGSLPWCSVEHRGSWIPFVVKVEYGELMGPMAGGGEGGTKNYFCFFGITIELSQTKEWLAPVF